MTILVIDESSKGVPVPPCIVVVKSLEILMLMVGRVFPAMTCERGVEAASSWRSGDCPCLGVQGDFPCNASPKELGSHIPSFSMNYLANRPIGQGEGNVPKSTRLPVESVWDSLADRPPGGRSSGRLGNLVENGLVGVLCNVSIRPKFRHPASVY